MDHLMTALLISVPLVMVFFGLGTWLYRKGDVRRDAPEHAAEFSPGSTGVGWGHAGDGCHGGGGIDGGGCGGDGGSSGA
jgi:hypothetical protein